MQIRLVAEMGSYRVREVRLADQRFGADLGMLSRELQRVVAAPVAEFGSGEGALLDVITSEHCWPYMAFHDDPAFEQNPAQFRPGVWFKQVDFGVPFWWQGLPSTDRFQTVVLLPAAYDRLLGMTETIEAEQAMLHAIKALLVPGGNMVILTRHYLDWLVKQLDGEGWACEYRGVGFLVEQAPRWAERMAAWVCGAHMTERGRWRMLVARRPLVVEVRGAPARARRW